MPNEYKSLGQLLPNLTRIHGLDLSFGAALSVAFNPHLKKLGLNRLARIDNGNVTLVNNYNLNTGHRVNWAWIFAHSSQQMNISNLAFDSAECDDSCPYCWGPDASDCQKNDICVDGSRESLCTEMSCPGTCVLNCKLTSADGLRCVDRCEDVAVKASKLPNVAIRHSYELGGKCLMECPEGYYGDLETHKCVKSDDGIPCPRVGMIGQEADALKFEGCTSVSGSLTISVDLSSQMLERSFGHIVEVQDYVMIFQTLYLQNLNFLTNLTFIRGESLWNDRFSFVLFGNAELGRLSNNFSNISVAKGSAYVHSNPSLCFSAVDAIKGVYGSNVSEGGNSKRGLCDVVLLDLTITDTTAYGFTVHWNHSSKYLHDKRNIIGHSIYYGEATGSPDNPSVSDYNFKDSFVIHVEVNRTSVAIKGCNPRTSYQVLVRSMLMATDDSQYRQKGEQSLVMTVKTDTVLSRPFVMIEETKCNPNFTFLKWEDHNKRSENERFHFDIRLAQVPWPSVPSEWITRRSLHADLPNQVCPAWQPRHQEQCWINNEDKQIASEELESYLTILFSPTADVSCDCGSDNSSVANLSAPSDEARTSDGRFPVQLEVKYLPSMRTRISVNVKVENFKIYWIKLRTTTDKGCSPWSLPNVIRTPPDCTFDIPRSVEVEPQDNDNRTITVLWEDPLNPNGRVEFYIVEFVFMEASYKTWWFPEWKQSLNFSGDQNQTCPNKTRSNYLASLRKVPVSLDSHASKRNISFTLSGSSLAKIKRPTWLSVHIYTKSLVNFGACYGYWATNSVQYEFERVNRDRWPKWALATSISIALAVLLLLVFVFLVKLRKKLRKGKALVNSVKEYFGEYNINFLSTSSGGIYEADEWEVGRDDVTLGDQLGVGAFGSVHAGTVVKNGEVVEVAIKSILETCGAVGKLNFLREASVMKKISCDYVVQLVGIVSRDNPALVIMELMGNGDLKNFLRSKRPDETICEVFFYPTHHPFNDDELLVMAAQIATGMAYLSSKSFVHRDLASRNCMVAKDGTVKIGDFGMTRDVYQNDYYRKHGRGPMPVRWMPPESLLDGVFTTASDVWSYGVVLWEISTLGSLPYPGLSNEDVITSVSRGKGLQVKELGQVPDLLKRIMKNCWEYQARDRPTFTDFLKELPALEGYEALV
eukprot:m.245002 g.245002  ORF g.245002 m.245002 type:complete len:1155 (+) comp40250_c0_seq7:304-3768(+)